MADAPSQATPTACPSCGARVPAGRAVCDLCGTPVADAVPPDAAPPDAVPPADEAPAATNAVTDVAASAEAVASYGTAASDDGAHEEDEAPPPPEAPPAAASAPAGARPVFCTACGWKNPSGANFCAQCGTKLQALDASAASEAVPAGTRPVAVDLPAPEALAAARDAAEADEAAGGEDAAYGLMSQQLALLVGGTVLLVVALFFITTWSRSASWGGGAAPAETQAEGGGAAASAAPERGGPAAPGGGAVDLRAFAETMTTTPLPPGLTARADSLRARIDALEPGVRQRAAQRELVGLYVGAEALGRAALLQQDVAAAAEAEAAAGAPGQWRRAGDLLLRWMESLNDPAARAQAAAEAVTAYDRVVEAEPENLDVRTMRAVALMESNNPMQGVQEINYVLEQDPEHIPARLNKGIALLWIGRADQAVAEFERVREVADTGSPFYQQATQLMEEVETRRGGQPGTARPSMRPGS